MNDVQKAEAALLVVIIAVVVIGGGALFCATMNRFESEPELLQLKKYVIECYTPDGVLHDEWVVKSPNFPKVSGRGENGVLRFYNGVVGEDDAWENQIRIPVGWGYKVRKKERFIQLE